MAATTSLSFPQMFDIARNRVGVLEDNTSIVNRAKLLIMTEPTELYNSPDFGVGLKRHLWTYNTENQRAIIRDRIKSQLSLHEPYCDPEKTLFADGLLYTDSEGDTIVQEYNKLKMTVGIITVFGDELSISFDQTGGK